MPSELPEVPLRTLVPPTAARWSRREATVTDGRARAVVVVVLVAEAADEDRDEDAAAVVVAALLAARRSCRRARRRPAGRRTGPRPRRAGWPRRRPRRARRHRRRHRRRRAPACGPSSCAPRRPSRRRAWARSRRCGLPARALLGDRGLAGLGGLGVLVADAAAGPALDLLTGLGAHRRDRPAARPRRGAGHARGRGRGVVARFRVVHAARVVRSAVTPRRDRRRVDLLRRPRLRGRRTSRVGVRPTGECRRPLAPSCPALPHSRSDSPAGSRRAGRRRPRRAARRAPVTVDPARSGGRPPSSNPRAA